MKEVNLSCDNLALSVLAVKIELLFCVLILPCFS
jgi:hypothetical protein